MLDTTRVILSGNARAARRLVDEGRRVSDFTVFTGMGHGYAWAHEVLQAVPSAQESLARAARAAGFPEDVIVGGREFALYGGPIGAIRVLVRELELGNTPSWEAWTFFLGRYINSYPPSNVIGRLFDGIPR